MTLFEKIAYLRKREGLSQEALAEKLSISRQSVYKWENGESMPSFDNIKYLAKLFDVSFDYLMDDSIDKVILENGETKFSNIQRGIYSTNIGLSASQINIDNGYDGSRKAKLEYKGYCSSNVHHAESALKKFKITDIFQIQHNAATIFFYDSINYTCGFFYAGMIQFVCPIENVVGFTYGGGHHKVVNSSATIGSVGLGVGGVNSMGIGQIPTLNSIPDTSAWCSLSYKENNSIKTFDMSFSVNDSLMGDECESAEELTRMWMLNKDALLKSLEKLKLKILALIDIGKDIQCGKIKVEKVNYSMFVKANEELKLEYDAYLRDIKEHATRDNKKRLIKLLVIGGLIVVAAFIVIKLIFSSL